MADQHSRTPALMPGTHFQNICDKLLQSTYSNALWKRFSSGKYRVQLIADILFNVLYKFTLLYFTYLLTYLLIVEHFYVTFGDFSCVGFEILCGKTDTQTNGGENPALRLA